MPQEVFIKIISKLLRVGSGEKLAKILRTSSFQEIQILLSTLDPFQKNTLVQLIFHKKTASHAIQDFSSEILAEIFRNISREFAVSLLGRLEPDDVAQLIRKLPSEEAQVLLESLDPSKKIQVSRLLAYQENTAGAIMNPNFFILSETMTVNQAIDLMRTHKQTEVVFYLYVVDENTHLVGILSLRQLIMSDGNTPVREIMSKKVASVDIRQSQAEVARLISRHNFLAVPVTDEEKHLVGIIAIDDVIDVIQEEANQDLYRVMGVEKDERISTPIKSSIQKRAPWLIINLATAILAANVVNIFEGTIQKVVLLATFLPIVAGMGGNAGNQTLAIMIRAIALGEIALKEAKIALTKEISVGIANGVLTGIIMAIVAYYWKGLPILGLVIMLAMIGNLLVSSIVGVVIPLGLKTLKFDPAMGSTVILTTFTDCFGFLFFLGLATLFMHYFL